MNLGELDHAINLSRPKLIFASKSVVKRGVKISEKNAFVQKIIFIDTEIDRTAKKFTNKLVTSYSGLISSVKVSGLFCTLKHYPIDFFCDHFFYCVFFQLSIYRLKTVQIFNVSQLM